jgi:hypothetical protein
MSPISLGDDAGKFDPAIRAAHDYHQALCEEAVIPGGQLG